ncbi:MAG: DUF302 domain-containing protein [Betaproteobacteria bacterium]|nr:MAG: DUF302 domain-containing protein [Betaproteobacteria bacterium]
MTTIIAVAAAPAVGQDQISTLSELRVDVVSKKSFENTIEHLKWRFGEHGLVINWASNYAHVVNPDDSRKSGAVVFELLQHSWLQKILANDPTAAMAMPIRLMVIRTPNGETLVTYYRVSVLMQASDGSGLQALGESVDEKLTRIVRLATSN